MNFNKWSFTGCAEFFNRDIGEMDEIKINSPIQVQGRSEAEALNRVKFNIRKNKNLPMNTRIALFDYTLEIIPEESDFKYSGQTKKCDLCGTLLTDTGECPKCDLLDDRYDEALNSHTITEEFVRDLIPGESYYFTYQNDKILYGTFKRKTPAWLFFDVDGREVWTSIFSNVATKKEDIEMVLGIVDKLEKDTKIPTQVPNRFTRVPNSHNKPFGETYMRKLRIIESIDNKEISILDFKGLSKDEIKSKLDNASVGTTITGVRDKSGRYSIDTHIEKKSAYKSNYFNPLGSPHDYKSHEEFWTVGGSEQHYMIRMISEILNDTSKYYKISPELTMTFDKEIYGIHFYSEMTDINFFAVHEDKQVLRDNWKDICEYITGPIDDDTQREQLFKDLSAKGIIFGSDEIADGQYWHEATDYDPYDEEGRKLDYFVILLGSIQNSEDWYKINIISNFSSRF